MAEVLILQTLDTGRQTLAAGVTVNVPEEDAAAWLAAGLAQPIGSAEPVSADAATDAPRRRAKG